MRTTRAPPPSSKGPTTSIRHSGRSRSSRSVISSATMSGRSPRATPPPEACATTWRATSKSGSSTHAGFARPSGVEARRRRRRGKRGSRAATCERRSARSIPASPDPTTTTLQVWPRTDPASSLRIRTSSSLRRSGRVTAPPPRARRPPPRHVARRPFQPAGAAQRAGRPGPTGDPPRPMRPPWPARSCRARRRSGWPPL